MEVLIIFQIASDDSIVMVILYIHFNKSNEIRNAIKEPIIGITSNKVIMHRSMNAVV